MRILGAFGIFVVSQFEPELSMGFKAFITLLMFSPALLLFWAFHNTRYWADDTHFYYQSAFLKGSIEIASIKKIELNTTMWAGIKPALATGGMIIYFNKFDSIYIAPDNPENFVEHLLRIHSEIEVIDKN